MSVDLPSSFRPALAGMWSTIQSGDGAPASQGLTPHSKGFAFAGSYQGLLFRLGGGRAEHGLLDFGDLSAELLGDFG